MFWDYGGPKAGAAGKTGSASSAAKVNGAAQKTNGVQADGAFGTTMSPEFKVCRAALLLYLAVTGAESLCLDDCLLRGAQEHFFASLLRASSALCVLL